MIQRKRPKPRKRKKGDIGLPDAVLATPHEQFVRESQEYFGLLTRPLILSRTAKVPGKEFVANYSRMVDTIIGLLFQRAANEFGYNSDGLDIAVIAMGGYGRAELAPYSDVDILILCKHKTQLLQDIASAFIRLLWDVGFELGHSVESLVESEAMLSRDMDTKTALIESRWVCGSRQVAKAVERQISRIRKRDREAYLRRKIDDAMARHNKHGSSYQLIEPNVKLSPGGLRDLQTLVWLGQVGNGKRGLAALRAKGLLLADEQRELEQAHDFLLRVRVELHLATQSKQDQLTVAMQRKIVKALGYRSRGARLAVEAFMKDYYMHTRAVYRIGIDVLQELSFGEDVGIMLGCKPKKPVQNTLSIRLSRSRIGKEPLYVFAKQMATGRKLSRALRRRLEVVLNQDLTGRTALTAMRRGFMKLMRGPKNVDVVVRSMHEAGFLGRIIPEYNQLTCLKRYDLYHHYTVDEHSFQVLENLVSLGRVEKVRGNPLVRLYSELPDKRVLFLTALLHDVGKIEGKGHARKGAVLARKILKRMSASADEIELVSFLIEQHLVMSHFSQRRDPSDLDTMRAFCERVKNRTNLKYLCLLTYADLKATSPLVWTEWKQSLLWDLYLRAHGFMARKEKKPEQVYKARKNTLLKAFAAGQPRDRALAHLDLLPGGYILTMTAAKIRNHMEMIAQLDGKPAIVAHARRKSADEFTFCTQDKPYRLSQLCGVLSINDYNILHAFAFTRKDGKVIDVFYVEDLRGATLDKEEIGRRLQSIQSDTVRALTGELDLEAETARHAAKWRRRGRADMPVMSKIQFENDLVPDVTIIDIFAQDAPGLLYRITSALAKENLTIYRANISTEANRAIDSFYVADRRGKKIASAARLQEIRTRLESDIL